MEQVRSFSTQAILCLCLCFSFTVSATDTSRLDKELDELYRYLHANPELSLQEEKTSKFLAEKMTSLGFDVVEKVGGYGFVAVFENGSGPTVMIRTDTDGLPVAEQTGLEFASQVKAIEQTGQEVSVMHACGHDVHMTSFIGTATELVSRKKEWSGTLMMIGQPAEERGMGARMMLADGLFERFPLPDYNLALHVSAEYPAGKMIYTPGYAMANVDSVDINVRGVGGHGAYPHTTKDPIVLASALVMNLQTLVSRVISPLDPAVVTVGAFNGGSKHNVISNSVKLQLTVRSYSDEVRTTLLEGIERMAVNQARAMDWPEDLLPVFKVKDEYTPSVFNNPMLAKKLHPKFEAAIGADNVVIGQPKMGGEDFARYGRTEHKIPSLLFWIGAVNEEKFRESELTGQQLPSLHSPFFAPEAGPTIETGVKLMTVAAIELFNNS